MILLTHKCLAVRSTATNFKNYIRTAFSYRDNPVPEVPDTCKPAPTNVNDGQASYTNRKFFWHTLPFYYSSASKLKLTMFVVLSTFGGCLAAPVPFDAAFLKSALAVCASSFFCSAAANSFNQLFEYPYDSQMKRTASRVLPLATMSVPHMALFSFSSLCVGLAIAYYYLNTTTLILAITNYVIYSFVYTPLKQVSISNTWIGAIVGALSPLAGWAAVVNYANPLSVNFPGAFFLPLLMYSWQFPHFNALSWLIREDYTKSGYRMMVNENLELARKNTVRHSLLISALCCAAPLFNIVDPLFIITSSSINLLTVYYSYCFGNSPDNKNALSLFKCSLLQVAVIILLLFAHKKELVQVEDRAAAV